MQSGYKIVCFYFGTDKSAVSCYNWKKKQFYNHLKIYKNKNTMENIMPEGVAYQNRDILFKVLGQTYKEKALQHMESISRQSGNCFQQTFLKFQQMKRI